MDLLSLIGLALGLFAVFGGAMMEGIPLGAILIPTAAIIVFGGTLGAVMLQASSEEIKAARTLVARVFKDQQRDAKALVQELLELSRVARRDGMLALEGRLGKIEDRFLAKAVTLLIDGVASAELRSRLEVALTKEEERYSSAARVYESAGGYAPTVGILGAVLGLIHVMKSLDDPSKLGPGIAVAFVATVYGVGIANLVALPIAGKIKARARADAAIGELVIEGVAGMADGQPTSALEQTLQLMLGDEAESPRKEQAEPEPAGAPA